MTEPEPQQNTAVYVSWITFKNAIDRLAEGIPGQIDRSVFPGLSWGVQGHLMASFKFLGLIDEKGKPTAEMKALAVPDEDERKKQMAKLFKERYAALFALDLTTATPAQLTQAIGDSYGATGATRIKAARFFLSAAVYLGIPLSAYLNKKKTGNGQTQRRGRTGRGRGRQSRSGQDAPGGQPQTLAPAETSGMSKTITMHSGGTLTVSASLNVFALNSTDRTFLFELIGKLEEYERSAMAGQKK